MGTCSANCGHGYGEIMIGRFLISGNNCDKSQTRMEKCLGKCNDIDCQLSEWKYLFNCTKSCGGGFQVLHRHVKVNPLHNGKKCPIGANEYSKTTNCNTHPCSGIL